VKTELTPKFRSDSILTKSFIRTEKRAGDRTRITGTRYYVVSKTRLIALKAGDRTRITGTRYYVVSKTRLIALRYSPLITRGSFERTFAVLGNNSARIFLMLWPRIICTCITFWFTRKLCCISTE